MNGNYCNIASNQGCAVGRQGLNAYEIAVRNGFEGTEQEWLESLKGDGAAPADTLTATTMSDNFNSII